MRRLEQSFLTLADNEEWLAANLDKIVHSQDARAAEHPEEAVGGQPTREIEEHVLRCLGAAVILQWCTTPAKLQHELFNTAGSMGELMRTSELRGQISRFLNGHMNDVGAFKAAESVQQKNDLAHGATPHLSPYTVSSNV
jgi:hypothetical protein